jgi:hypothetical protein
MRQNIVNETKMAVCWDVTLCSLVETDRVSEVLTASFIRAIKNPVSSSETSVGIYRLHSAAFRQTTIFILVVLEI